MLGDAISSLPVRLSVTTPKSEAAIGSRHGDHALRHATVAALPQRTPDARAQGDRRQGGLAAAGALARAAAHARAPRRARAVAHAGFPRRGGSGKEDGRAPPPELARDLPGPRGSSPGAAALPIR